MKLAIVTSILIYSIFCHAVLSQPFDADAIFANDRCASPLRISFYNEIRKTDNQNYKNFVKRDWCKSEIKKESEAQERGFDLGLVYNSIELDVSESNKFSKALAWKSTNCGNYLSNESRDLANSTYERTLASEVVIKALEIYGECINRSQFGLYCSTPRHSSNTIGFYASYIPMNVGEAAPTISYSTVSNARRIGASQEDARVFVQGSVVTPTGISEGFTRLNDAEDVVFSVKLSNGSTCPIKVIKPEPRYTITVSLVVHGRKTFIIEQDQLLEVTHVKCIDTAIPVAGQICPKDGNSFDLSTFKFYPTGNPHMENWPESPPFVAEKSSCFSALNSNLAGIGGDGCVRPTAVVRECSPFIGSGRAIPVYIPNLIAACDWARANKTKFRFAITGRRTDNVKTGVMPMSWANAKSGSYSLVTDQIPADWEQVSGTYKVIVVDLKSGAVYNLDETNTYVAGINAIFDSRAKKLLVTVP